MAKFRPQCNILNSSHNEPQMIIIYWIKCELTLISLVHLYIVYKHNSLQTIVRDINQIWPWKKLKIRLVEHRLYERRSTESSINWTCSRRRNLNLHAPQVFCTLKSHEKINSYHNWLGWFNNLQDLKIVIRKTRKNGSNVMSVATNIWQTIKSLVLSWKTKALLKTITTRRTIHW